MPLTAEEMAELRENFRYNDFDEDGRIDFGEFLEMLDQLDSGIDEDAARIGFGEIDSDEDGVIGFEEFIEWWQRS